MTEAVQIARNRMAMHVGGSGRGLFYGTARNLHGQTKKHHEEHLTAGDWINITLVIASSTAEMKKWWSGTSIAS